MRTVYGYNPYPWQSVVHNALTAAGPKAGKIFVVKSPRQIGKSYIVMMELLRHAINYPRSNSICVTLTFKNCMKMYKELSDGVRNSGLVEECHNGSMVVEFKNGSTIEFKSAIQRENLRGYTIKRGGILCIDEAAYMQDDIFGIIFPWVQVNNANILMTSTPRLKQGTFYQYFKEGLDPANTQVESFDLCEYDTSRMLSQERVETYRKLMPPAQFTTEILGQFADDLGSVFYMKADVWYRNGMTSSMISSPNEYSELVLGLDWGTGQSGDYTAMSGIDFKGTQHVLSYFNSSSPMVQINLIKKLIYEKLDYTKIKALVCETNSIGRVFIDMIKEALPNIPIIEFTTSNASKREIIEYLIKRFNEQSIMLIRNNEQYYEFSSYMMEITKSGNVTYNGKGAHDDIVMATAFAFKYLKDLEKHGNYNISFGGNKHSNMTLKNKYS